MWHWWKKGNIYWYWAERAVSVVQCDNGNTTFYTITSLYHGYSLNAVMNGFCRGVGLDNCFHCPPKEVRQQRICWNGWHNKMTKIREDIIWFCKPRHLSPPIRWGCDKIHTWELSNGVSGNTWICKDILGIWLPNASKISIYLPKYDLVKYILVLFKLACLLTGNP